MPKASMREPQEGQLALERLAREDEASRSQFLKMVGGAGAAGALAVFMAACGGEEEESSSSSSSRKDSSSAAKASAGDLEILNYALTLEYLEADFYQQALDSGEVKTKAVGEVAKEISENENQHVQALLEAVKANGGKPAAKPTGNFDAVLMGGEKKILTTAATVENLGAAAYLGQAGNIESKEILAAALSIHSNEGRHAAVLNQVTGKSIVPDGAFSKPATMEEVLAAVKPFIKA